MFWLIQTSDVGIDNPGVGGAALSHVIEIYSNQCSDMTLTGNYFTYIPTPCPLTLSIHYSHYHDYIPRAFCFFLNNGIGS